MKEQFLFYQDQYHTLLLKVWLYHLLHIDNAILFVSEEIINKNNSIPTILVDGGGSIIQSRNIEIDSSKSKVEIEKQLKHEIEVMAQSYEPIVHRTLTARLSDTS